MSETTSEPSSLPIPSVSIEALLARRGAAQDCLVRIRQAVAEVEQIGELLQLGVGYDHMQAKHKWTEPVESGRNSHYALNSPKWYGWAKASLDAALWEHLLALSGMRTFLDAQARDDWYKAINENKTPDLTASNVRETFRSLHSKRQEFFERGVLKVFRDLSWDYKSNKPQKFGLRLIVRGVRDSYGFANSRGCNALVVDQLNRILHKHHPDALPSVAA